MNPTAEDIDVSLEALKKGDRAAFARLVEITSPAVYRVALRILGNEQDAEDVLQETYIKALQALPQFEGRSSVKTWLHRIAVNEALMLVRRRHPEAISVEEPDPNEDPLDGEGLEIVDWCCLPENELLNAESRKALDRAVDRLPQTLKVVFLLRDQEEFSIKETAEMLKLSEAVVKTRLLRARLKLRQELSRYFGEKMAGYSQQEEDQNA